MNNLNINVVQSSSEQLAGSSNKNKVSYFNKTVQNPVSFSSFEQIMLKSMQTYEKTHKELLDAFYTGQPVRLPNQVLNENSKIDLKEIKSISVSVMQFNLELKCKLVDLKGFDTFNIQPVTDTLKLDCEKVSKIKGKLCYYIVIFMVHRFNKIHS